MFCSNIRANTNPKSGNPLTEFRFHVESPQAGLRADQFLTGRPGFSSRSALRRLFDQGLIQVNGRPVKAATRLKPGDVISGALPEARPSALLPEPLALTIIHQDSDLAVVDKPAGMVTHPTSALRQGTLVNALLYHCRDLSGIGGELKPGIVHRLDKLTSGVMVAAKTDAAHQSLAAQFKAHTIDRRYLALCHGELAALSGRLESPISRNPRNRLKMTGRRKEGRAAITHYKVLARGRGFSLLECRLATGRTHQIRVHLSEQRHPLVGDALYGSGRSLPASLDPEQRAALKQLKRQALHAYRLGFEHPRTGEFMAFESPPPSDLRSALAALGFGDPLRDLPEQASRVK